VAFNGGAAALQGLLGGQVGSAALPRALLGPWLESGALQGEALPAEVDGLPAEGWFALLAGPGWTGPQRDALEGALLAALSDPVQSAWLDRLGLRPLPERGERLAARIRGERARARMAGSAAAGKKAGTP
jgi:tripartite-type tricarboxylate transporter receptor subunit TctC